jgi:hypothetical protein
MLRLIKSKKRGQIVLVTGFKARKAKLADISEKEGIS